MHAAMTVTGISSMATRALLADLAAAYTRRSGLRVAIESVGGVAAARRVADGEAFDVVVLASNAIDGLAASGHVDDASRVSLARSGVAVAAKAGAAHPSIETEADLRDMVRHAHSIGYSTGPSGAHLMTLFERWGIADEIAARIVQAPPGVAVASLIARGEAEFGFQQMSELIGVDGIEILGALPQAIQSTTVFQAALGRHARAPQQARAWLAFLTSPDADAAKRRHGMQPA
jgi:molybdate transport system substrate-binding protein